ncbi:MAG: BON domain-containing protein [Nitrospirae bacterium]|nr:BON domain-containing protein [Nitrospirota bacterium]
MKKFIFMALIMVFGLATFSGCATMTGRTVGEHVDDTTITAKVNDIIVQDHDAKYLKIDVTSTEGNVVLQGSIHDRTAEDRIVEKIRKVKGVKSVKSLLKLKGDTAGEYIDDSVITVKVNAEIVKDPDAKYFKIDVTTTQGEVVLQGYVNSRKTEDRLVANIRDIKGVKSVKSLLKIEEKK